MEQNTSIGIKIHDVHHGLIQTTGAIVESEFAFLKELGAAIQIATTIKDHETIDDLTQFYAAAGELSISRSLANTGLQHLEHLGYVRLKHNTGKTTIGRIDTIVPDLSRVYFDFGDYFVSENDRPIALKTINVLEKLSAFPHKEKDIISSLSISHEERDLIVDVGKHASLIDNYTSPIDSESVLYSPLYWDDNPQAIFNLLKNHESQDFISAIQNIQKYQGIPDGNLSSEVVKDAILLGCLPTLSVNSTTGLKKFVFTPRNGVGKIEKDLLHKARVLISCVRYGENFAGISRIYSPEKLINALLKRGFLAGHTESLRQYDQARNIGLVKLIPSTGGRYEVHFIDNEENKRVVDLAVQMLQIGDTPKFDNTEETAKKILLPGGGMLHPTQTRTKLFQAKVIENSTTTVKTINDLLRGIQ